jgi:hypothetical protein
MNTFRYVKEGLHMFRRHRRVQKDGFARLSGVTGEEIVRSLLVKLWNGKFFQTDLGNYPQFYSRDFGMVLPALLHLGFRDKARKTLAYALDVYAKAGKVTSHITSDGKAVNFPPAYSPDSVAYLLKSVRLIDDAALLKKHKHFLQRVIDDFADRVLDGQGRVRRGAHFAGMRDHAVRDASCYDTVMAAVVQREADLLDLEYTYSNVDYQEILLEDYWNGRYFDNDMTDNTFAADANVMPFWHNIIVDKEKLQSVINHIQKHHLDKPFPLKYVRRVEEQGKTIIFNMFSKNWQANSIWPMIGLPYIDIVMRVDKNLALKYYDEYKSLIEKYGTFLEVYDKRGLPYESSFFSSGEGMIWAAMWLVQGEELGKK